MTSETIDTIDELMARYVAGALPLPASVLVQSHLAIRTDNHGLVGEMEALAGAALQDTAPIDVSRRDARLEAIFAAAEPNRPALPVSATGSGIFPQVLRDFVGMDVDDIPWRTKMPGFREHDVGDIDGCHVSLFWIRPGRKVPQHTHVGSELTLILDGAFNDDFGRYGRGDISVADGQVDHRPIAEMERPCIGFAVVDGRLQLTGTLRQRLGDIIGR